MNETEWKPSFKGVQLVMKFTDGGFSLGGDNASFYNATFRRYSRRCLGPKEVFRLMNFKVINPPQARQIAPSCKQKPTIQSGHP
jgi:hypothetical protein